MTGVSFTVDLDDAAARRALTRLAGRAIDLEPAMDEIGAMLVASTLERFERGEDPDGQPWTPSIRALEQGGQTLVDTTRLRGSITHEAARDSVTVGTNVIYAAIHQLGGKAGRSKKVTIPERAFLGVNDDDAAETGEILTEHLAEAFG